jgi:Neuraminidase (sialidase)
VTRAENAFSCLEMPTQEPNRRSNCRSKLKSTQTFKRKQNKIACMKVQQQHLKASLTLHCKQDIPERRPIRGGLSKTVPASFCSSSSSGASAPVTSSQPTTTRPTAAVAWHTTTTSVERAWRSLERRPKSLFLFLPFPLGLSISTIWIFLDTL